MYENCGPEYYDIFMKQFMQTLGQLGAAIVTSALAVPVYTYYTRNFLSSSKNQSVNEVYNTENENEVNLANLRFFNINISDRLIQYELSNVFIETKTICYPLHPKSGKFFSSPYSRAYFDVPVEEFISFKKFPVTVWVNFDFIYDTSPSVTTRTTGAKVRYELTDNKPGSTVHGPWYDDQRED